MAVGIVPLILLIGSSTLILVGSGLSLIESFDLKDMAFVVVCRWVSNCLSIAMTWHAFRVAPIETILWYTTGASNAFLSFAQYRNTAFVFKSVC